MNSDIIHLVAFLSLCFLSFYGGAFLYSLVHYEFIKKRSWLASIVLSFMWMILYALVGTTIADIGVAALKSHLYINTGMMVIVVALPYLATGWLYIKSRHV